MAYEKIFFENFHSSYFETMYTNLHGVQENIKNNLEQQEEVNYLHKARVKANLLLMCLYFVIENRSMYHSQIFLLSTS